MDAIVFFALLALGSMIPVAVDIAGHVLNRQLLKSAHVRLDRAEWRAERVAKRLGVTLGECACHTSPEAHDAELGELSVAGLRADVRADLEGFGDQLVARFEEMKVEARKDAETRIAAANESMNAQLAEAQKAMAEEAARLEAEAKQRAEAYATQIVEEAKSEAGRILGTRSGDARTARKLARAEAEAKLVAAITGSLGETMAGRLIGYVQQHAAQTWAAAVDHPETAETLLSPFLQLVQRGHNANAQRAATGGSGWG